MTHDIFISYKREDEVKVAKLAKALEESGFTVWWDRSLLPAQNWRNQIQAALDSAKCVIVVWTKGSAGPDGEFVRDEAVHAKTRGILVPVMMQKTRIPLGFGEIQYVDLVGWRGSKNNVFFKDLVGAVRAKLDGTPPPKPRGPLHRIVQRTGLSIGPLALLAFGFISDIASIQKNICSLPIRQPALSDTCGGWGLGDKPTKAERLAWAKVDTKSCESLRAHVDDFTSGVYRDDAADLLSARRIIQQEVWTPSTKPLPFAVYPSNETGMIEKSARDDARNRAQNKAELACRPFAATQSAKFISASFDIESWDCSARSSGYECGLEAMAHCELEVRGIVETEICGGEDNEGS